MLRSMITASFQWASSHGLVRTNPVHQEEEARLVLSETFDLLDQTASEMTLRGDFEAEDQLVLPTKPCRCNTLTSKA